MDNAHLTVRLGLIISKHSSGRPTNSNQLDQKLMTLIKKRFIQTVNLQKIRFLQYIEVLTGSVTLSKNVGEHVFV